MRALLRSTALVLLCAACRDQTAPGPVLLNQLPLPEETPVEGTATRRVARVRHYGDGVVLSAPTRVRAGDSLSVSFTAYGGGCTGSDTTVVRMEGRRVVVVPYQRIYTPRKEQPCGLALHLDRRVARIAFLSAGTAEIVLVGRSEPGDEWVITTRGLTVE